MKSILIGYEKIKRLSSENNKRFGEVFLLKRKTDGELVVMKTVEKSNKLGYDQLKNEVQFSFEISGLPKIIETKESDSEFYFLKKYEEGISLNEYWPKVKRRHRLIKLNELISGLEPIFSTLQKQGIVHCDVKPENIVIEEKNGELNCSLIDFGLAFYIEQPQARQTLFQLAYSAPEVVLNRLNCADFSTDVFSFCLVVFKLLVGQLPFSNNNPALQTQLQITYPIEKPFKIKKKVWKVLEKGLIKHQFKKSPNKYSVEEIDSFLQENNKKRYTSFKDFSKVFKLLTHK